MTSMSRKPAPKIPNLTPGQTIFLGSAIVLASLGGFYANLLRMEKKRQERGTQPHYEYLMGHVASRRNNNPHPEAQQLPISRFEQRSNYLPAPLREQNNGHFTIPEFKLSAIGTSTENPRVRFEQPTPQRPKEPGSSVVYTKSPDYAKSYGKAYAAKENDNVIEDVVGTA
ncbi:hypothetical protein DXG03_002410 [Asterophora parasitica]|uniref:Uncharacterized protein n=1 Tax=Asterophora parasitica TaxID=117018 RepID=A0A9P7GDJ9_9AGAR|nr:hypothetical protein DXG03_002410 [Asterophora parasitica]